MMSLLITLLLVMSALLGTPLFAALGAAGIITSLATDISPDILIIEMNRLAASPNMQALPLFILSGVIMSTGGMANRLVYFYRGCFGWLPGGLSIVALTSCAFFTMFSGASGVTILALGGLLYPMLRNEGYPKNFSLGLLTTSGSLGLLFPPSLAIILYSIVANVSIEKMFLAGLLPGLILLLILAVYGGLQGYRSPISRHPFSIMQAWQGIRMAIWDLLLPVGIVLGIFGGFVSISEAAVVTAAYSLFIETLIHREIQITKQLPEIFSETSILFGSLLIILLIALGLTNLMIDAQLPEQLFNWIESWIDSKLAFLLLLNVFLLCIGAIMDIFSALIVVVPLILPLAERYQINPIHLGIIFLANLEIGYSTPPVGINLFIASQRFKQPVLTLFRSTLPFLLIMLIWLLSITYLPLLSLWWLT